MCLQQALKRVYYSAYLPVRQPDRGLPDITEPPLVRENRLYQSDWLIRLYGFSIDEVIVADSPYLDLKIDPKQAFALRHPELFPVDNKKRLESRQNARPSSHLQVEKLAGKVRQQAHRMKGFVRFQQTEENKYLALIVPRYDVLPLVRKHFEARFADQKWIIYDAARNYGIGCDTRETRELRLDTAALKASPSDAAPNEEICQCLWRRYYDAVSIPSRSNPKLHARMLPRRYWRYLREKQQR